MAATKHEFQVTVPAVDAEDVNLSNGDNFDVIDQSDIQEKTPVIILLGWAGCVDKHLEKYSGIYQSKRFITIRHVFPTNALFFKYDQLKPMAETVLDVIFEQNLQEHPLFFHIFSNGGSFVYCHITDLIHNIKKYANLHVKGTIIDSAPGKRRVAKATEAFMNTLQVNYVLKYIMGFFLVAYLVFSRIFNYLFGPKERSATNPFYVFENMCEDKARWPQLFLFSKKDSVVLEEDIQEAVKSRKEQGVMVWNVCWEDSGHVAHFRTHREAYSQKCHEFVSFCLEPTK